MDKSYFIKQLDEVIKDYNVIKSKAKYDDLSGDNISDEELTLVLTKSKAAVARIVGANSEYYKDIDAVLKKGHLHEGLKLKHVIGTIMALKSDLQNDYLKTLTEIVHSEVFSDYLDMAEYLAGEGYKDAAAVLAGSTLEAHLKELAKSNRIDFETNSKPKKASTLNDELTKATVYSSAYQKQITAWLAIRNDAAHGNYDKYNIEQVKLMIQGIRHFTLK